MLPLVKQSYTPRRCIGCLYTRYERECNCTSLQPIHIVAALPVYTRTIWEGLHVHNVKQSHRFDLQGSLPHPLAVEEGWRCTRPATLRAGWHSCEKYGIYGIAAPLNSCMCNPPTLCKEAAVARSLRAVLLSQRTTFCPYRHPKCVLGHSEIRLQLASELSLGDKAATRF